MIVRSMPAAIAGLAIGFAALMAQAQAAGHPHFTYEGAEGPEHWGQLADEYATCSTGHAQSPVDLGEITEHEALQYSIAYNAVPLTVLNNGHTVQFAAKGGGAMTEDGVTYDLQQIHFHAPSEHVINDEHMPLEAHFVHQAADGRLAVLGVFIVEGAENPTLTALFRHLPESEAAPVTYDDTTIDPNGLLPADLAIYRYDGSLTTPPCSEGVAWHVLKAPVTASKEQIDRLAAILHGNARPEQPLNGRMLVGP